MKKILLILTFSLSALQSEAQSTIAAMKGEIDDSIAHRLSGSITPLNIGNRMKEMCDLIGIYSATTSGRIPYTDTGLGTYFLTRYQASQLYLSQSNASSTYLTQASAASTYLTQSNASSTYLTQSNAASTYLTISTAASTYAAKGANTDITSLSLNQTGLVVKGATSTALTIKPNETLTSARTLNIVTGDASRTLTFGGNITTAGNFTTSGANALTLTTSATTNATLPSGTTTLIGSSGGTISSNQLILANGIQAKWAGFTIEGSSSTGHTKFNMQTGGYDWEWQYNGVDFWYWHEGGSGGTWRILELMNKGVLQFDMTSGLPPVAANGQVASDGTDLYAYLGSSWQMLNGKNAISATAITGTSNINLTYDHTTKYVDASGGSLDINIIPTAAGQAVTIKRIDATGFTVRVKMQSGNIDGSAIVTPTTLQSQYGALTVQWDGTNGLIINKY